MDQNSLYEYMTSYYKEGSMFYSALSEDNKNLIALTIKAIGNNVHPKSILTKEAYQNLKEITAISFDEYLIEKTQSPKNLDIDFLRTSLRIPLTVDNQPNNSVSCVDYSCSNNLSSKYPYANTVDFATCSNDDIEGMHCIATFDQTRCPKYTPDVEDYSHYSFSHNDFVYEYKVVKYRHRYGNQIFDIYDSDNNLLNQLSYDLDTYSNIDFQDFSNQIQSIVKEIHNNLFYKDQFSFTELSLNSNPKTESKSYLATLIS